MKARVIDTAVFHDGKRYEKGEELEIAKKDLNPVLLFALEEEKEIKKDKKTKGEDK